MDNWQVTELQLNAPAVGGWWYGGSSPLSRGLHVHSGYVALYTVAVWPGFQYTLQLSTPHHVQGIHAYLYDRWPLLPAAHHVALPTGPVVVTPHVKRITYRWNLGIAARSTGNLLYILVSYPGKPDRRHDLAPRIEVRSPPISPRNAIGHGITYLQGPRAMMLIADSPQVSYVLQPVETLDHSQIAPDATSSGDLVSNGRFSLGMKNWVPVEAAAPGRAPATSAKGLRLPPTTGVRQELDADVAHANALLLQADLRLEPATSRAPGANNDASLAIALCFQDRRGKEHCGATARQIAFHVDHDGTNAKNISNNFTKYVPAAHWYRYQIELMSMKPAPMRIESISLLSLGGQGSAWVREIHLFLRSNDHAMQ